MMFNRFSLGWTTLLRGLLCIAMLGLMGLIVQPARAARPALEQLLPKKTLLVVRTADIQAVIEELKKSSLGQIAEDPELQTWRSRIEGEAAKAFEPVNKKTDVKIEEIPALANGEVIVAVVDTGQGEPVAVIMADVDMENEATEKLIEYLQLQLERETSASRQETIEGTKVKTFPNGDLTFAMFERDSTLVFCSDVGVVADLLAAWNGSPEEGEMLADNTAYQAMKVQYGEVTDSPSAITWFVDPIAWVRAATRGNVSGAVVLAMLPALGLDGVEAVGGSFQLDHEDFEVLYRIHLLLESPRSGIFQIVSPEAGSVKPENWVPADAAGYMTLHWNFDRSLSATKKMVDAIQGEGTVSKTMKDMSENLGIDLETELLPNLGGRVTLFGWYPPEARMMSRANVIGIQLKDGEAFQPMLEKLIEKAGDNFEEANLAGIDYHVMKRQEMPESAFEPPADESLTPEQAAARQRRQRRMRMRMEAGMPQPAFAVMDDYLIITDRVEALKAAITAAHAGGEGLAESYDYTTIAGSLRDLPEGKEPMMVYFDRPAKALEAIYRTIAEEALDEDNRANLRRRAEDDDFSGAINRILGDEEELPPFAVFEKYLTPRGGMMTDDQFGLHFTGFTLRRK